MSLLRSTLTPPSSWRCARRRAGAYRLCRSSDAIAETASRRFHISNSACTVCRTYRSVRAHERASRSHERAAPAAMHACVGACSSCRRRQVWLSLRSWRPAVRHSSNVERCPGPCAVHAACRLRQVWLPWRSVNQIRFSIFSRLGVRSTRLPCASARLAADHENPARFSAPCRRRWPPFCLMSRDGSPAGSGRGKTRQGALRQYYPGDIMRVELPCRDFTTAAAAG